MRLALKLTVLITVVLLGILFVRAYVLVDERIAMLEDKRRRNQEWMARALAPSVGWAWHANGPSAARSMIAQMERMHPAISVRLIPLDDVPEQGVTGPDPTAPPALDAGRGPVSVLTRPRDAARRIHTYLPLDGTAAEKPTLQAALELSSDMPPMRELLIDAGRRELFWLAILGGFGVLISLVIGTVAIGRPVRRLADQARAVGSGDFAARVELRQKDELALLAREMNRMAERLEGTLAELQREQDARFIALDQLRHAERLTTVGRLAAGVAHELGTPLNVVSGRSALIMGEPGVTRQIREHVEVIARQSDIMAKTIRQLLDFARRRPATKAVGDLGQLAEETLAFLNQLAAKKRLQLTSELPPNPVLVRFDPAQIQQVLTNLVVNAIHATRRGRITVTCGWREAAPPHAPEAPPRMCAFLSVADEGCGIPRELLPHIFDPFMTTKDQGEGTGLGLSVSYGIVEEHGGWIDVDTEPGAGATFTVYLPEDDRG